KALITPLRERWVINLEDGPDLHAHGNFVDHEYTIERDGAKVAEVSKRWFRVRDTYGVEVAPGENDVLILAATAVIDTMAHPASHSCPRRGGADPRVAASGSARRRPPARRTRRSSLSGHHRSSVLGRLRS